MGTWHDNYLCAHPVSGPSVDVSLPTWPSDFLFSNDGPPEGYSCTRIWETNQEDQSWEDNYLCWSTSSPYELQWSHSGEIENEKCISWDEPTDLNGWGNNYLCSANNELSEDFVCSCQGELDGENWKAVDVE